MDSKNAPRQRIMWDYPVGARKSNPKKPFQNEKVFFKMEISDSILFSLLSSRGLE
jgi:hypothetical protein